MSTKWRVVASIGFVLGLGELIDSFFIGWGAIASVTFAVLFFVGVWLTTKGASPARYSSPYVRP